METHRFNVTGRVQGVGYRAFVMRVAWMLGVKGVVRNLEDESVEIICQADENVIARFKQVIDKKAPPDDILSIDVQNIDDIEIKANEEFGKFQIDYGPITKQEKETACREELTILHGLTLSNEIRNMRTDLNTGFDKLGTKMDDLGKKTDDLGKKMDDLGKKMDDLGRKIDDGFDKTHSDFVSLDQKYHTVSGSLKSMEKSLKNIDNAFKSVITPEVARPTKKAPSKKKTDRRK